MAFVFAAQMFGAGKTRIGREFIGQLSLTTNDIFEKYCPLYMKHCLQQLLDIVREFSTSAKYCRYDCLGVETYDDLCKCYAPKFTSMSQYIVDECAKSQSCLFFHFDEIGDFSDGNLRRLRNACLYALKEISY